MPFCVTLFDRKTKLKYLIGSCKNYISTDSIKADIYQNIQTSYSQIKKFYIIKTLFIGEDVFEKLKIINNNSVDSVDPVDFLMKEYESNYYNPQLMTEELNNLLHDAISLNQIIDVNIFS